MPKDIPKGTPGQRDFQYRFPGEHQADEPWRLSVSAPDGQPRRRRDQCRHRQLEKISRQLLPHGRGSDESAQAPRTPRAPSEPRTVRERYVPARGHHPRRDGGRRGHHSALIVGISFPAATGRTRKTWRHGVRRRFRRHLPSTAPVQSRRAPSAAGRIDHFPQRRARLRVVLQRARLHAGSLKMPDGVSIEAVLPVEEGIDPELTAPHPLSPRRPTFPPVGIQLSNRRKRAPAGPLGPDDRAFRASKPSPSNERQNADLRCSR